MKKVMIFHHVAQGGGGTISLNNLCRQLCEKYEVVAVIPRKNSETLTAKLSRYARVIRIDGIFPQFAYYSGSRGIISRTFVKTFFTAKDCSKKILEIAQNEQPDIIIANSMVELRVGKILSDISAKKIMYIHETFIENFISKKMIKFIGKYFDAVLCISPYEKEYAKFKIPCEVVADCEYKSENKDFKKEDSADFNVLYLGGIPELKGARTLLRAVKYVDPCVHFVLAGRFDYMPPTLLNRVVHRHTLRYQKEVRELIQKAGDRIECLGFVNDIASVIKNADVIAVPFSKAHQSRAVIEAAEYEKPVIISDFKQLHAYCINGYNCLSFDSEKPSELAKCIEHLRKNKDISKKLVENNKKMNEQYHNVEKEKQKLLSFLENIV